MGAGGLWLCQAGLTGRELVLALLGKRSHAKQTNQYWSVRYVLGAEGISSGCHSEGNGSNFEFRAWQAQGEECHTSKNRGDRWALYPPPTGNPRAWLLGALEHELVPVCRADLPGHVDKGPGEPFEMMLE
jgi:hypothetical protein